MTADATAQLIQRINSQLPPETVGSYENATTLLGSVNTFVGIAANYAGILSLFNPGGGGGEAGDAAAAAEAAAALQQTSHAEGGAAEGVAAAAAGAVSGGVGAVVVIYLSFVMATLSALSASGSTDDPAQIYQDLITRLAELQNTATLTYYQEKLNNAENYWVDVYTDLNNLQHEGVKGSQVQGNANQFITDAQHMVVDLLDTGSGYWERPPLQELQFSTQSVGYGLFGAQGWYGQLPRPHIYTSSTAQGGTVVSDPNTMMPLAVWAIQAYLAIMEVAHEIDSTQYTFLGFLQHFWTDLRDHAQFLYSQYTLAVGAQVGNGIDPPLDPPPYGLIKSDMPSLADVTSFMAERIGTLWLDDLPQPSPLPNLTPDQAPAAGDCWNGIYGVADQFAPYPSPLAVPSTGLSCILDFFTTDGLSGMLSAARYSGEGVDIAATLAQWVQYNWTYPWFTTRLTLSLMARWKALYLVHGHSFTWSIIQNLRALAAAGASAAGKPPLPAFAVPQLPDGTLAHGDWSVRELVSIIVKAGPAALFGATETLLSTTVEGGLPDAGTGYSVYAIITTLDLLARSNWAGGPDTPTPLSFPVSFRDRLAAAASV